MQKRDSSAYVNDHGDKVFRMMSAYYTRYYRDSLGLSDWLERVALRMDEERTFGGPVIDLCERSTGMDFRGKQALVVGAGTGAELFALAERGASVHAIEPSGEALEILKMKSAELGLDDADIQEGAAEDMPFADGSFDLVVCYMVLEHVNDIRRSIDEMIRVARPGGVVFLSIPDYLYFYEGHYKLFCYPPALPLGKRLLRAYLKRLGRPLDFMDGLNFITSYGVLSILRERKVGLLPPAQIQREAARPSGSLLKRSVLSIFGIYSRLLEVSPQENIFIVKG